MTDELFEALQAYVSSGGYVGGRIITLGRRMRLGEIDERAAMAYLNENREPLFTELLFSYIDRTGLKDSDIYKRAFIDRRLFSKIRSDKNYTPAKKTVIALCLALRLSRRDTDKLLSAAGYSLSRGEDYDLIIAFCIEKKIFDFDDINDALYRFGLETF